MTVRRVLHCWLAIALWSVAAGADAHSASDAYLTLDASGGTLSGQWDIALRDLNFVLQLDADGDGNITWDELRPRQAEIARYALAALHAESGGQPCTVRLRDQRVATHADGAYAALTFDVTCTAKAAQVTLDYRLFFALDPSHRGIAVIRSTAGIATALLSPDHTRITLQR